MAGVTMPNPRADQIQLQSASFEDPKHALDREDDLQTNEDFNRTYQIEAIIHSISESSTDEYTVDLYEEGFTLPSGEDGSITRPEIVAHATHNEDWFVVGDKVRVRLMPDHTAWIVHDSRPQLAIVVEPDEGESAEGNKYILSMARYWDTGTGDTVDLDEYDSDSINYLRFKAENLSEKVANSHGLAVGTPVIVEWNWNLHDPIPVKRYFFTTGGSGLPPGTGRYKVLMLLDDLNPGTPGWDRERFD